MNLKEQVAADLNSVFFIASDFAEVHSIGGRDCLVVIDSDRLEQRSRTNLREMDGMTVGDLLFFVRTSELEGRPEVGAPLIFDNRVMQVFDVKEDAGMYEIVLIGNRG